MSGVVADLNFPPSHNGKCLLSGRCIHGLMNNNLEYHSCRKNQDERLTVAKYMTVPKTYIFGPKQNVVGSSELHIKVTLL